MQELAVTKQQQEEIRDLSLDQIANNLTAIDKQSKLMIGFYLLEARSRFPADRDFGEWRWGKFPHLDRKTTFNLMSLAKFFSDKPIGNIPISVGYILSSPTNIENGISDLAYEEIIKKEKVSLIEAKEIISSLYGDTSSTLQNHLSLSESEDWYTPEEYMQTVREFFNGIDLDPCTCDTANKTVKAKNIFTKKDNSLNKEWFGKVFMNPPYGKDGTESVAGKFCNKLIEEYETGNIKEAVILVNSSHSQKWQQPLYEYAVCFVDHRIKFVAGDGSKNDNPTFNNIFVYLGERVHEFAEYFSHHGYVMERI